MDPFTLLAAFGPLFVDAGKALINKYFAPDEFKPANVDDYVKMRQLDLEMFKAMNEAGGTNPSYPWVEAAVRMMRPSVAMIVLITWSYAHYAMPAGIELDSINNFAAAIGFYLFGDRTLFYSKKALMRNG